MNNIIWTSTAWKEYVEWQGQDRKNLKRINQLLQDNQRNGISIGIGKTEPLKYRPVWSRQIDKANCLVYNADDMQNLIIFSCKDHYEG